MDMEQTYKYFAFISYNSKDTVWGKKVQQKLEHYRMPATMCSEHGWSRTPIKPVFFAPTDILPGGLSEELKERLRASRNLIVICSPNSAKSEWVGKEITFFHSLGRTKHIHFFIVEGEPHSGNEDTECFNPVVKKLGLSEILGANIHEQTQTYPFTNIPCPWLNKQRAYVQLVSKLLGVEFDAVWQRHKRLLIQKIIAWAVGFFIVVTTMIGVWIYSQPVNVELRLQEISVHNDNLPPLANAIVTFMLDNESKNDTIYSLDDTTTFTNIPHHYLNKEVRIAFKCQGYMNIDTTLTLTTNVVLNIYRDPSIYGNVHFRVWSIDKQKYISNVIVKMDGQSAVSDSDGYVSFRIPIERQRMSYPIEASLHLITDTIYPPCGPDDALLVE